MPGQKAAGNRLCWPVSLAPHVSPRQQAFPKGNMPQGCILPFGSPRRALERIVRMVPAESRGVPARADLTGARHVACFLSAANDCAHSL
jgi:hypothetical protein